MHPPIEIPFELLKSLQGLPGFNEAAFVEAHKESNKVTSVRLNPFKPYEFTWTNKRTIPWCDSGYYLTQRPSFTHDPLFHAGAYYVQEAGSMFIETILKQTVDLNQPIKILDLCAAPGGKSTLINSLINSESLLVANEVVKSRAEVLSYNLSKWGTNNAVVTNNEPSRFTNLHAYFDVILIDAPCSGSGLFRKQPEAINEWSEAAVESCSLRQKNILEQVLPALKQNGILVYSTCSYSELENESNANFLINQHSLIELKINLPPNSGIVESSVGYRFYPHLVASEGFYCAVFRKAKSQHEIKMKMQQTHGSLTKTEEQLLNQYVDSQKGILFKKNNRFYFTNSSVIHFISSFEKQFYFKKAGTCVGEIKGKDLVPDHELALSVHLNKQVVLCELTIQDAITYLRKQNLSISHIEPGLKLVTHSKYGLGWAKVLTNRMNNYLPNEYRVFKL